MVTKVRKEMSDLREFKAQGDQMDIKVLKEMQVMLGQEDQQVRMERKDLLDQLEM